MGLLYRQTDFEGNETIKSSEADAELNNIYEEFDKGIEQVNIRDKSLDLGEVGEPKTIGEDMLEDDAIHSAKYKFNQDFPLNGHNINRLRRAVNDDELAQNQQVNNLTNNASIERHRGEKNHPLNTVTVFDYSQPIKILGGLIYAAEGFRVQLELDGQIMFDFEAKGTGILNHVTSEVSDVFVFPIPLAHAVESAKLTFDNESIENDSSYIAALKTIDSLSEDDQFAWNVWVQT